MRLRACCGFGWKTAVKSEDQGGFPFFFTFVAFTFLRALTGQFGPKKADGVAAAALYWHTVVGMWSIAWYLVYVTK